MYYRKNIKRRKRRRQRNGNEGREEKRRRKKGTGAVTGEEGEPLEETEGMDD